MYTKLVETMFKKKKKERIYAGTQMVSMFKDFTSPSSSLILLLNSFPSITKKFSVGSNIPHLEAIDLAVLTCIMSEIGATCLPVNC
jgi:hypothetical protein